jgi:hypothetical protein
MKTLRLALPLVMMVGWAIGAGCEDDRGAVNIGAGGEVAQPGGAGGEASDVAGAGAGGAVGAAAGAGGAAAGAGGVAAGAGGAAAGAGGAGGATACPEDIDAAEGKACAVEDMVCGDGSDNPCQFGQAILCFAGKWQHQESFPAPCGGAGGQASGGAAGAGGAG